MTGIFALKFAASLGLAPSVGGMTVGGALDRNLLEAAAILP